ncbi:hypothetical protein L873DRAFT_1822496, partial [Choiromyces venosus 120613-1]
MLVKIKNLLDKSLTLHPSPGFHSGSFASTHFESGRQISLLCGALFSQSGLVTVVGVLINDYYALEAQILSRYSSPAISIWTVPLPSRRV